MSEPDPASYSPLTYGRQWAADYDELDGLSAEDTAATVAALARLAADRPVLELAAGTGRVAIPLAQTGLAVTATDISPEMLACLAARDRDRRVVCRAEDMTTTGPADYGLVAVLVNSLCVLLTPDEQQAVFDAAASRLVPGGLFVVETGLLTRFTPLQKYATGDGTTTLIREGAWDAATQRLSYRFYVIRAGSVSERQVELRWVFPNEARLMAAAAGLVLVEQWSDWHGQPFGPGATNCISVYRKPDPGTELAAAS